MKLYNSMMGVVLTVLAVLIAPSAQAFQCTDDFWEGGFGPTWSQPNNWTVDVPDDDLIAVFSISSDTLMDLAGEISWPDGQPWVICSWLIEDGGAGEVALGAFEADSKEYATALSTWGDLVVDVEDYGTLLNEYIINIGPLDGVFVGDGLNSHEDVVLDAETYGVNWNLLGKETGYDKAWAGVTGKIGGGEWTASRAGIGVGIMVLDGDYRFTEWYDDADGIIDSAYPSSSPGDNDWTLDMVELYAKRCENLDEWTINHSETSSQHGHSNLIFIRDFFEANQLTFNAGLNYGFWDEFRAYMQPTADITTDGGLHVKDFATFRAAPGHDYGPQVHVENLRVRENATLSIDNGTTFDVTGYDTATAAAARIRIGSAITAARAVLLLRFIVNSPYLPGESLVKPCGRAGGSPRLGYPAAREAVTPVDCFGHLPP